MRRDARCSDVSQHGGGMSGPRRDADSPLLPRQILRRRGSSEKCAAGVPIRRGSDSPRTKRPTRRPTLIISQRMANPSRDGIVRHATEVHFSGRRPRRRGSDVAPPAKASPTIRGGAGLLWTRHPLPHSRGQYGSAAQAKSVGRRTTQHGQRRVVTALMRPSVALRKNASHSRRMPSSLVTAAEAGPEAAVDT
jgi:hypothetical protein